MYSQMLLDVHGELIVDLFAGGGGASVGIEMALGRSPDVAVNHDAKAVAMHRINHPQTQHLIADVFEVDPRIVTRGRRVGLLWTSPDCTDHSKAKGGKPIRTRKRRALAWVVRRWAGQVRPRVIVLENVEEFVMWGPLVGPPGGLRRCKRRAGRTFRRFVRSLRELGYVVEWRERRACDSGAPTIRKRLYMIARCDGQPIVWPEPTHGPGRAKPYRTAAECIDWSIPMLSIFASKDEARGWAKANGQGVPVRPLAEATMRRIARGVKRYVLDNPRPFIVGCGGRQGQSPERPIDRPYQTITAKGDSCVVMPYLTEHANASGQRIFAADEPLRTQVAGVKGGHFSLVAPTLVQTGYGERNGQAPRSLDLQAPLGTIVGGAAKHALVASFLAQHNDGFYQGAGRSLEDPAPTFCASGSPQALVAAHLGSYHSERRPGEARGSDPATPLDTIDTSNRHAVVYSFLQQYYGNAGDPQVTEPLHTVTTKDRFGVVTVTVDGQPYAIADIAMRMLWPHELFACQGFPASYIIDRGVDAAGRIVRFSKSDQVHMCGNSVSPEEAAALVRANVPEMIARDEALPPARRARRKAVAA